MFTFTLRSILAAILICQAGIASADSSEFSFTVIAQAFSASPDEAALRTALAEADADNLAFVVANGIKSTGESCNDQLYNRRKSLLDESKNGLILSLAASDWAACRDATGGSAAIERLSRLRDLFFTGEFSFGKSKLPVVRQSAAPQFRSYGENARWEFGDILFATINLPADNNHYLSDAGRNSEFEDRLIANRIWLQRAFSYATQKKLDAIVLFSDGNPLMQTRGNSASGKRDGFAEMREKIQTLAAKFPGKVLIVHNQPNSKLPAGAEVRWTNNLGSLDAGSGWTKLTVMRSDPRLFIVARDTQVAKNQQ